MTRRDFLKGALMGTGVGLAGPLAYIGYANRRMGLSARTAAPTLPAPANGTAAPTSPAPGNGTAAGPSAAPAAPPKNATKNLVVIQLAGGNDGLATVLPFADPLLKQNRGTLTFTDDQLLKLNDKLAFHPNLKGLKALYDQRKVAVLQGVGYPDPNRSHFISMDVWATGTPGKVADTGWLGRYLDAANLPADNPFNAVSVGGAVPLALKAKKVAVPSVANTQQFALRSNPRQPQDSQSLMAAFTQIYQRGPQGVPYYGLVEKVEANTAQAVASLKDLGTKYHSAVSYPQTALGRGLQQIAQLMTGGFGTKVYYASSGGFDTHANEKPAHDRLMSELSDAVAAFYQDLQQHGLSQQVVMMTWSEFGRRVKENGSGGTDHGTAAPMFVIGDGVKGGVVGEQPSLSKLDKNGDLLFGVDFRSVYNTILTKWLGMDGQEVLGGKFDLLPLF
ncbi:MAG: DUF1501 domain-containing protein [Chloroflexota bacterium]|nr:DUF1501 domain-containing protein [Chloroflexota bacterium]